MTPTTIPRPAYSAPLFGDRVRFAPAPPGVDNHANIHPTTGDPIPCRIARIATRLIIGTDYNQVETTYQLAFPARQPAATGDQYARLDRAGRELGARITVNSATVPSDPGETLWVGYGVTVE